MKKGWEQKRKLASLIFFCIFFLCGFSHARAQEDIWVSAYYAGWSQGCGYDGRLRAYQIDYSAVTHIIHFAIIPNSDGSIDYETNCITPENSADLIQSAHAAGKKVLISVGGWQTESDFLSATNSFNRARFIQNLTDFITSRGYDGIDVDWEPISLSSYPQFRFFVSELRSALDTLSPRPLLTGAAGWYPELFAETQQYFDQINIMTYDLSGLWLGPITWHNSAIYDGNVILPNTGWPAPSVDVEVEDFISNGVEAQKLGIGIAFFGYIWKGGYGTSSGGVTEPGQIYTTKPSIDVLSYYQIMDQFYNPQNYRWDFAAQAAYLSFDNIGSTNDMFISYDDETTCYKKVDYVRAKGIGGITLFELGGGWRPGNAVPDILLQTVKSAVYDTSPIIPPTPAPVSPADGTYGVPSQIRLTWNASTGATSYSVQVSTNSFFSDTLINSSGITDTSYLLNNLSSNTTYYWRVKASNSSGASGWSEVRSFKTAVFQTAIINFSGASVFNGILLTWQTISEYENKGFDIERRLPGYSTWSKIGFVPGAGISSTTKNYSFTDRKTKRRVTYSYRLKQINIDGTYSYSPEVKVQKD
jgi:chitinase